MNVIDILSAAKTDEFKTPFFYFDTNKYPVPIYLQSIQK